MEDEPPRDRWGERKGWEQTLGTAAWQALHEKPLAVVVSCVTLALIGVEKLWPRMISLLQ